MRSTICCCMCWSALFIGPCSFQNALDRLGKRCPIVASRHISSVPLSNCVERVSMSISRFHSLAIQCTGGSITHSILFCKRVMVEHFQVKIEHVSSTTHLGRFT